MYSKSSWRIGIAVFGLVYHEEIVISPILLLVNSVYITL